MTIEISLPKSHTIADNISVAAQKEYLLLTKLQLLFLFLSIVFSIVSIFNKALIFIVFLSMFFSIFTTILLKVRKKDRVWFDGRAVAESIKTLSWRFIMGAHPFPKSLSASDVEKKFNESIYEIFMERKNLSSLLITSSDSPGYINSNMHNIRNLTTNQRLEIFLEERIKTQQNWYAAKCIYNRNRENLLFILSLVFQGAAFFYLILLINFNWNLNITAIFSALATIVITWLQVKQHQELAQAYGLAAQELDFILSLGAGIDTEDRLSEYVNESENAISREHTLWVARRGQ